MMAEVVHWDHLLHLPLKKPNIFQVWNNQKGSQRVLQGKYSCLESLITEALEDPFDDNYEWVNLADNDSDNNWV